MRLEPFTSQKNTQPIGIGITFDGFQEFRGSFRVYQERFRWEVRTTRSSLYLQNGVAPSVTALGDIKGQFVPLHLPRLEYIKISRLTFNSRVFAAVSVHNFRTGAAVVSLDWCPADLSPAPFVAGWSPDATVTTTSTYKTKTLNGVVTIA